MGYNDYDFIAGAVQDALDEALGTGARGGRGGFLRPSHQLAAMQRHQLKQQLKQMPLIRRLAAQQAMQAAAAQNIQQQQLMGGLSAVQAALGAAPALIDNPDGGVTLAPEGSVPQGKLYPLSFTTIAGGAAAVPVAGQLAVRAERGFRPTRLIIEFTLPAGGGLLLVSDIDVGTGRQVANLEPMPATVFANNATFARVNFDVIRAGTNARIGLIWIPTVLNEDVTASGAFYGTEL